MTAERLYAGLALPAAIIGLLIGLFWTNFSRNQQRPGDAIQTSDATGTWSLQSAKRQQAEAAAQEELEQATRITNANIRLVKQALLTYPLLHNNLLPQSLKVLVDEGLLGDKVVLDGWGNPFVYQFDPDNVTFSVRSLGPDGIPSEDDIPRQ